LPLTSWKEFTKVHPGTESHMAMQSATVSTSPNVIKSSACTAAVKLEKV